MCVVFSNFQYFCEKGQPVIRLSEFLPPRPESDWKLIKQAGVNDIVGILNGGEHDRTMFQSVGGSGWEPDDRDEPPWSLKAITHDREVFERWGFNLVAIEDTVPMDKIRFGHEGRDEQIEQVIEQIRAMGALGIEVLSYNWMACGSWARTDIAIPDRGGALVTGYHRATAQARPPLLEPGETNAEQMWEALAYFLEAVIPEAEKSGVRLALHPDDPPQSVDRGVPRIMSSVASFQRVAELSPSESNGFTFCQGNFALMEEIVSGQVAMAEVIRDFGASRIPFVHFRDVRGTVEQFQETFHDDGQTDMAECLRAYYDIGFEGVMRPDHVPTLEGESNDRPGYHMLGRLFALGYIRGLEHSAYGHPSTFA
jgi:mannonate dehydratase